MLEKFRIFCAILICVLAVSPVASFAEEQAAGGDAAMDTEAPDQESAPEEEPREGEEQPSMHYELTPKFSTYLGFRFVDIDGSRRAAEYDFLHSGVTAGTNLHYFPLPHRLDFELDYLNEADYDTELSYAYRDLFKLDLKSRALWHNTDHLRFLEPRADGFNSWTDREPNRDYGVSVRDNRLFLRLKWPDNPYHVYAEVRQLNKDGDIQQRFVLNRFGNLDKFSTSRLIEWDTRTLKVGANGHFGPVEVDYHHGIKAFDAGGKTALYDAYAAFAGAAPWPARAAGTFRHNNVADLERTWDSVRLHTSYTGRIVGALEYRHGNKNNRGNLSHATFNYLSGNVTLIPASGFTVMLRYRHDDTEVKNQERVREFDYAARAFVRPALPAAKPSISSEKDMAQVAVKYSPCKDMGLKADYKFENVEKENAYTWSEPVLGIFIPASSNTHTGRLSFWSRPHKAVSVRANALYSYCTDPMYPTSYRDKVSWDVSGAWIIRDGLNLDASCGMIREKNPYDFHEQETDRNRRMANDTANAVLSWSPLGWLSMAGYYNYNRTKITDTTTFEVTNPAAPPPTLEFYDTAPYRMWAHVYGLTAETAFEGPANFQADFHQSFSRTRGFYTAAFTLGASTFFTNDIGDFSNGKVRETGGSLTTNFRLPRGFGASLTYAVNNYEDLIDNFQDGSQDGTAHSVLMLLSKRW